MKKCLFVYNSQSGKGRIKNKENKIVSYLSRDYQVEVCVSQYAGHIGKTILEKGNVDLIVVAGGDGTLNEVINAVMQSKSTAKIGIIPAGTVNDVAHSLGIKRKIKKALETILTGKEFKHDVFRVNNLYGIYVCCAGLFTETSYATSQSKKRKIGKIAYVFHALKSIFSTKAIKLKLAYQGGEIQGRFALMLLLNSRSVAGFHVNKNARLNDGLIDVVLFNSKKDKVGLGSILWVAVFFLRGLRKKNNKNIVTLKLDKFYVDMADDTVINIDGEKVDRGNFDFEVIREGVKIIVPSE